MRWLSLIAVVSLGCSAFIPGPRSGDGTTDTGVDGPDGHDTEGTGDPVGDELPGTCEPFEYACFDNDRYQCDEGGTTWDMVDDCLDNQVCEADGGCRDCYPGERICLGQVAAMCDPDSMSWLPVRDCEEWGTICVAGYCDDVCGTVERDANHLGCEFWATPMPTGDGVTHPTDRFGIIITNPSSEGISYTIHHGEGLVDEGGVGAGESAEIDLDYDYGVMRALGNNDWQSVFIADGAYRIRTTGPVSVVQYAPRIDRMGGLIAGTTGSSLLLPRRMLTNKYYVTGVPGMSENDGVEPQYRASYLSIVAVAPGDTELSVQLGMHAEPDSTSRITSTDHGTTTNFRMTHGEVLHLATRVPPICETGREYHMYVGGIDYCFDPLFDPSDTRVDANQPVAVFSGTVDQRVPYWIGEPDHMQEQIPPWVVSGQYFVVAPMVGPSESAVSSRVRIHGLYDMTGVSIFPAHVDVPTGIGGGGTVEFEISEPYHIETTKSVIVTQLLDSEATRERGAPAMTVIVPSTRCMNGYTFAVPASDGADDALHFMLVVRSGGDETIRLDGAPFVPDTGWTSVPMDGREVGIVQLMPGTRTVSAEYTVGVQVFGVSAHWAYAHPAGMLMTWEDTGPD